MEDVIIPNECLQLVYHRAVRRHLLILYPKEILIMDLGIKQVGLSPCTRVRVNECAFTDQLLVLKLPLISVPSSPSARPWV